MIRYRLAEAGDVPVVHAMLSEMASAEGDTIGGSPQSLLDHGFGAQPRFRVVLAEEGDATLGFCLFLPEYSSWRGAMGLFVQDVFLRPTARGKGLGRGLLQAAFAHGQDWHPDFIALMVKRSNRAAMGFYQSLGFEVRDQADPLVLEGAGLRGLMAV